MEACEGFAWIGQTFSTCDNCGVPFWWHTHEQKADRTRGPFDMVFENVLIGEDMRKAVWRKWEPAVRGGAPDWHRQCPTDVELAEKAARGTLGAVAGHGPAGAA